MGFSETILFYLLFGGGVATAIALRRRQQPWGETLLQVVTSLFFWPLYVPLLLQKNSDQELQVGDLAAKSAPAIDQYANLISHVEDELDAVLHTLDGWTENVLSREGQRIAELRAAWRSQSARIREIDQLLAQETCSTPVGENSDAPQDAPPSRVARSTQARRENFARLQALRNQLSDDLLGTLAWVRELISMIHLARFTGAPASRTEELVSQVATAVEGLSEVTRWQTEEGEAPPLPSGVPVAELPIGHTAHEAAPHVAVRSDRMAGRPALSSTPGG